MRLLLDLGNTRAKWAFEMTGGVFAGSGAAAYDDAAVLSETILSCKPEGQICLLAVAAVISSAKVSELCDALRSEFAAPVVVADTLTPVAGLRHAYSSPEKLGLDRWLAMLGVAEKPVACVADVGTAVTIDVQVGGQHQGGVIVPGENLMADSLLANTAQIAEKGDSVDAWLGEDTAAAVSAGVRQAVYGLLSRYQMLVGEKWPEAELVLTGGGAGGLAGDFPAWVYRPNLVLEGLSKWLDLRDVSGDS